MARNGAFYQLIKCEIGCSAIKMFRMHSGRSVNDSINLIRKDEKITNDLESRLHCLMPASTVLALSSC